MSSIFSKIQAREIPGHILFEDEHCFSILTIAPIREGHVLVIPRAEINHWDDLPTELAAHLMLVSQRIAKAIKFVVNCKRVGMSIIGLEVPHTHLHLIPINTIDDMNFANQKAANHEALAKTAVLLRAALQN